MDSSADAALMNTTWSSWYWIGGFFGDFIIPMAGCIQDPNATVGEKHEPGCASSGFSVADR